MHAKQGADYANDIGMGMSAMPYKPGTAGISSNAEVKQIGIGAVQLSRRRPCRRPCKSGLYLLTAAIVVPLTTEAAEPRRIAGGRRRPYTAAFGQLQRPEWTKLSPALAVVNLARFSGQLYLVP